MFAVVVRANGFVSRGLHLIQQKSRGAVTSASTYRVIVTFRIPNGSVPAFHSAGISRIELQIGTGQICANNSHRSAINQISQVKRNRGGGGGEKPCRCDRSDENGQLSDHSFIERRRLFNHADARRIINTCLYQRI